MKRNLCRTGNEIDHKKRKRPLCRTRLRYRLMCIFKILAGNGGNGTDGAPGVRLVNQRQDHTDKRGGHHHGINGRTDASTRAGSLSKMIN